MLGLDTDCTRSAWIAGIQLRMIRSTVRGLFIEVVAPVLSRVLSQNGPDSGALS